MARSRWRSFRTCSRSSISDKVESWGGDSLDYLQEFVIGGIVVVSGAIATALIAGVRWLFSIKGTLDSLVSTVSKMSADVCDLYRIQLPQLAAQRATLEAFKGEVNGNVDRALAKVEEAEKIMGDTLTSNLNHSGNDRPHS